MLSTPIGRLRAIGLVEVFLSITIICSNAIEIFRRICNSC